MGGGNEDASDLERANEVARQIQSRGLDVLPPELVDFVFAHTLYDKTTISACTLVSRNWRAMCIPHLFSSLTVVRQTDTFADFEHFLDTQKHVASYVQELEIKQLKPPQAAVACDVLAAMCQKLPGLKVLRLRGLWILDPMFDSRAPTSPGMVHLKMKALHLDSCSNGSSGLLSSQTLHAVLDIFPTNSLSLIYLAIANTDSQPLNDDRSSENPPIQRNRVRVATLSLHRVRATSPPPLDVLHQILAPQCLQTFRARWVDVDGGHPEPPGLRKLGKFLGDVGGAQLRHLEFPVTIGPNVVALEDKPDHWRALQLHTCRNLESITVRLLVPPSRSLAIARKRPDQPLRQRLPLSAVLSAFVPLLPPSLHTYSLVLLEATSGVPRTDLRSREKMGLERLDNALSKHLPALTKVQVVVCDSTRLEDYSSAVFEVMPKCRQRGILEIFPYHDARAAGIILGEPT